VSASVSARPLRVLVCPHELVRGGSQINAIDLAARLRDRGHTVEVYAPPGPLVELIEARGLAYREAPRTGPTRPRALRAMAREIARFSPDIVHTYESWPTVSAAIVGVVRPHRAVTTVLSMDVPDYLPEDAPLIVGTAELADRARARRDAVHLLEPPIDVDADAPGDTLAARRRLGVRPDAFVVSVVGRLSAEHEKARGVAAAIDALAAASDLPPTTLLVAGDGDDAEAVRAAARRARESVALEVVLLGDVPDPRDVYDAADVVFGMGGSALRGLAHAKPLIVQGRDGFWLPFGPDTADVFLSQGFFGSGDTGQRFVTALAGLRDPAVRRALGEFGRGFVTGRFGLDRAAHVLEDLYTAELTRDARRPVREAGRTLVRFARYRLALAAPGVQRGWRRLTGRAA
jgi:glycosyltransferase involved in cell wall biosynthesis